MMSKQQAFGDFYPNHEEKEQWLEEMLNKGPRGQAIKRETAMVFLLADQYEERFGANPYEALQHVISKVNRMFHPQRFPH